MSASTAVSPSSSGQGGSSAAAAPGKGGKSGGGSGGSRIKSLLLKLGGGGQSSKHAKVRRCCLVVSSAAYVRSCKLTSLSRSSLFSRRVPPARPQRQTRPMRNLQLSQAASAAGNLAEVPLQWPPMLLGTMQPATCLSRQP